MASGSEDQRVQCQSETLQCPICMKHIEDPRLCTQCSKLFCYNCLRQWLQKADDENGSPTCPNCRCMCSIDNFVKILEGSPLYPCKPISEGIGATDQLATDATDRNNPDKVLPRLNKLLLETQGLYNETKNRVTQELEKQHILLNQTKNNLVKTVNFMIQQELKEIHQQYQCKHAEINAWSEILTNKLVKHQFDITSVQATLAQSSPAALIVKQSEIEKDCAKLNEGLKSISLNLKPHDFQSTLIPEPSSWKFTVHKYSSIRRTNEIQYSDFVSDDIGSVWRLEVHPCGYEDAKNTSLSVFLQLYNGVEGHYHYSFELLGPASNHFYEDETYFEQRKGWGQNHFIDLKSLQESFLVDDGFNLKFSVRALNLVDKYGKMKKRADLLNTEVEQLKKIAYPDCLDEVIAVRSVVDAVRSATCLYSDILCDDIGNRWRLQIYPGGNAECKGQFISIFLEFCSGIPNKFEFTVALLHQNAKKIVKKSQEYSIQPSQPYGWKTFLAREELINNGYIQKDSLSIRLTIKPSSATQKLNYLRQHMQQLQKQNVQPVRKESVVSNESNPTTSQEPIESRIRKASISIYKNLFAKSSSTEQQ